MSQSAGFQPNKEKCGFPPTLITLMSCSSHMIKSVYFVGVALFVRLGLPTEADMAAIF